MGTISDKFNLFIPNKRRIVPPEPTDYGDNWRRLEQWGNQSGLMSFIAGTTPPDAFTTPIPAPLNTKFFIQAEGFTVLTFSAGGQATLVYKQPFPNGTITLIPSFATGLAAGVLVVATCTAATAAGATIELHSQAAGVTAYVAGAQAINYIAIGW